MNTKAIKNKLGTICRMLDDAAQMLGELRGETIGNIHPVDFDGVMEDAAVNVNNVAADIRQEYGITDKHYIRTATYD